MQTRWSGLIQTIPSVRQCRRLMGTPSLAYSSGLQQRRAGTTVTAMQPHRMRHLRYVRF